ncbi:hypothetical protein BaRGS_00033289, partial [Batillaria attramentaria]
YIQSVRRRGPEGDVVKRLDGGVGEMGGVVDTEDTHTDHAVNPTTHITTSITTCVHITPTLLCRSCRRFLQPMLSIADRGSHLGRRWESDMTGTLMCWDGVYV